MDKTAIFIRMIDFDGDGKVDNYTIRQDAFYNCYNLTSVTIPDCVKEIEYYAFLCCDALTTVNYRGTEEQWEAIVIDNTDSGNQKLIDANKVYNYTEE